MQQVGKYQLIRKLATGGMAEVFLAKASGPMGFEKTLVLKRILPHLAEEPAFVRMFLTEAKLAARLTHSHIAQIFDFGEVDGAYFLAMEYIDGPSLRAIIKRAGQQGLSIPPAVCARMVAHACEGLAFAHDFTDPDTGEPLHLIHRDICPDNLLLSRQGEVKVVDFGIAKAAGHGQNTEFGAIKGKLSYMPPEQARGQPLDRRTDLYALGTVLFELLTGRKAFEASSDVGLVQDVIQKPPPRLATLRPDLPEALQHILDQTLAKEREQRYPDCHAFQSDLEDFILSEGRNVTPQHVAQFIQHLNTGSGFPVLPPPGAPRSRPGSTPAVPPGPERREPLPPPVPLEPAPLPLAAPGIGTGRAPSLAGPDSGSSDEDTGSSRVTVPHHESLPELTGEPTGVTRARLPGTRWVLWGGLSLVGCALLGLGALLLMRSAVPVPPDGPPPPTTVSSPSREPVTPPPPAAPPTPAPVAEPIAEPAAQEPAPAGPQSAPTKSLRARHNSPSASKVARTGFLEVRVWPDATVFLNGKNLGDTPLAPTELPVGRYEVRFVNQKLGKIVTRSIEVKFERPTLLKVNLLAD